MELFGIGAGEMLLLLMLALIVVGPQKLPEIAHKLGHTVREFKAQTDALRSVMTFDPLTGAPGTAPAAPTPLTSHPDERVLALRGYGEALVPTEGVPDAQSAVARSEATTSSI